MRLFKLLLVLGVFTFLQPVDLAAQDVLTSVNTRLTAREGSDGVLEGELSDNAKPLKGVVIKIYVVRNDDEPGTRNDVRIKGVWYKYLNEVTTDGKGDYELDVDTEVAGNEFYLDCDWIAGVVNP